MFRVLLCIVALLACLAVPLTAQADCPGVSVQGFHGGGFVSNGFVGNGFYGGGFQQQAFFQPSYVVPQQFFQPQFFVPQQVFVNRGFGARVFVNRGFGNVVVQANRGRGFVRVRRGLFGGTVIRVR